MDVVIATHELCRTLGKVAKQKRRDSIRVEMVCGMKVRDGDPPCPFFVRAAMVSIFLITMICNCKFSNIPIFDFLLGLKKMKF